MRSLVSLRSSIEGNSGGEPHAIYTKRRVWEENTQLAMSSIERFTVSIPDIELKRLATKLSTASFPDELENSG